MDNSRYEAGLAKAKSVIGDKLVDKLLNDFKDVAPDMSRFVIEHVWADLFCRPELDVKTRELAAISSLATLGSAPLQLKAHINGALNVGCTPEEIIEVLLQLMALAGVPAAMNAIMSAREVFQERDLLKSVSR